MGSHGYTGTNSTCLYLQARSLQAVPRLVKLFNHANQEVQRHATGAMRNLIYDNADNKLALVEENGIFELLRTLREQDDELRKNVTGGTLTYLGPIPSVPYAFLSPRKTTKECHRCLVPAHPASVLDFDPSVSAPSWSPSQGTCPYSSWSLSHAFSWLLEEGPCGMLGIVSYPILPSTWVCLRPVDLALPLSPGGMSSNTATSIHCHCDPTGHTWAAQQLGEKSA